MMSCWQENHHLKCKILNSPRFSFFFGRINALFACLSESILARVQTFAWWQAVVWIWDAKICADSSFYAIWVRLSQLAIRGLKRHTRVQQIAPSFSYWKSEPAWWENVTAYTSLNFGINKHSVSKLLFKSDACLFLYWLLIACFYFWAQGEKGLCGPGHQSLLILGTAVYNPHITLLFSSEDSPLEFDLVLAWHDLPAWFSWHGGTSPEACWFEGQHPN